jgi:predicted transcriptional regulator
MISFACKKIAEKELITCSLGLNKSEYDVFRFLLNHDSAAVIQIAAWLEKDRSLVQKAIKELLKKKIIERRQRNIEKGGYVFVYSLKSKKALKKKIMKNVNSWCSAARQKVREL